MKRNLKNCSLKYTAALSLCLLAALSLTGCAGEAKTMPSPNPTNSYTQRPGTELKEDIEGLMPDMSPDASENKGSDMTVSSANVPDTLEKCKQVSSDMEEGIALLSEVDDVSVVAMGNKALIGISFEPAYQGELDERIKNMVLTRVQAVSKGVTEVYITTDKVQAEAIDELEDKLEKAKSLNDITEEFDLLAKAIPVYKK